MDMLYDQIHTEYTSVKQLYIGNCHTHYKRIIKAMDIAIIAHVVFIFTCQTTFNLYCNTRKTFKI